jgi:tRNA-intron endonuclease, archaea type
MTSKNQGKKTKKASKKEAEKPKAPAKSIEIKDIKKIEPMGKQANKPASIPIIQAAFNGENVFSNKKEAMSLYAQSRFGEQKDGKIVYFIYEALYLLEKNKMEIRDGKKKIKFEQLMELAREKDPNVRTKYIVFKDMRNRGFIVKTALKFGAEFRVYNRGVKPGEDHARWVLFPVPENSQLTWHDFSAKNRVAHSTKKNLLIGVVDEETDVTYYEIRWLKP